MTDAGGSSPNVPQAVVVARVRVARLLVSVAAKTTALSDSYSGWFLAGSAAAAGLVLANNAVLSGIEHSALRVAAVLLLLSFVAAGVQKWVAMLVAALVAGFEEGARIGSEGR